MALPSRKNLLESWRSEFLGKPLALASLGPILRYGSRLLLSVAPDRFWAQWGIRAWPFPPHVGPSGLVHLLSTAVIRGSLQAVLPDAGWCQTASIMLGLSLSPPLQLPPLLLLQVLSTISISHHGLCPQKTGGHKLADLISARFQSRQQNPCWLFQLEDTVQESGKR